MKGDTLGHSIPRRDAWEKALGETKYPADLYMEGMLYGKVVWSERPHAQITGLDTSAAKPPGVVAVLTARDVPCNEYGLIKNDQPVLADGKVRCVGDPVAVVVAESQELAEELPAWCR